MSYPRAAAIRWLPGGLRSLAGDEAASKHAN
jgi:hypothetical protein